MSDKKYTLTMKKTGSKLEFELHDEYLRHGRRLVDTRELHRMQQIIMTCSLCQQQKNVPDETVKALGHIETKIVVVRQPTCTVMGGYGWQRFWYKNNSVTTDTEGKELATPQHAEAELYLLSFLWTCKLLLETTLHVDGYSACRCFFTFFSR